MTPTPRWWTILATLLLGVAAPDGEARVLRGVAFAEHPGDGITVRVWALGDLLLADPAAADQPLAVASAASGAPFALSLEEQTGWCEVELSAPGHVSVARLFDAGETELPAAWLPEGSEVLVRVTHRGRPAPDAAVSGRPAASALDPGSGWRPVVARTRTDARGRATVSLPRGHPFRLQARVPGGSWGRAPAAGNGPAVRLELSSLPVRLTLTDSDGSPVGGALVADTEAPPGSAAVTDEHGIAAVQVRPRATWAVAARAAQRWGRWVGHGAPPASLPIAFAETGRTRVRWSPAGTVWLSPSWIPEALVGGAPIAGRGGEAWLASPAEDGRLQARSAGGRVAAVEVAREQTDVELDLDSPIVVRGRVTVAGGGAAPGVPVWLRGTSSGSQARLADAAGAVAALLPGAVSADDGRFAIEGLPAGWFRLEAVGAGFAPAASQPLTAARLPAGEIALVFRPGAELRLRALDAGRRPVAGATATLHPKTDLRARVLAPRSPTAAAVASTSAGADGRLRLADLRAGRYELRVEAPGLAVLSLDVELGPGGTDLGDVTLVSAARLVGWVVDGSGRGVAGVTVRATLGPPLGEQDWTSEAATGGDGEFALDGVPDSGELFVVAAGDGVRTPAPVRVPLPPAGGLEIEVQSELAIRGRVSDRDRGWPIPGAVVSAESIASEHVVETLGPLAGDVSETDSDGAFELRLLPGTYRLRAEAAARKPRELEILIDGSREPEPLDIELAPGERLRGRVTTADGRPAAGVEVDAVSAAGGAPSSRGRSREDGVFELDQLGAGRYEIRADGGSRGTARRLTEVPSPGEVELRLEPGAVVAGRVVTADGAPPPAGEVYIRGHGSGLRLAPQPLQGGGGFRFEGLPAGVYTLRASAAGWGPARRQVRVAAGERLEVVLELGGGGAVEGLVRGLEAHQLARCQILGGGKATLPAADGWFFLEDVALGRQTIAAIVSPGGPERSIEVELLAPGDVAEVELDFGAGPRLTGTVRDRRGPMPGVSVVLRAASLLEAMQTLTDAKGSFELLAPAPGAVTLSVVDRLGRLLLGRQLVLTGDLDVELTVEDLAIRGQVLAAGSEAPVALARVRLRAVDGRQVERTTTTDGAGRFELTDLGAGAYRVDAEADGYGSAAEEVLLDEGSPAQVRLRLPPAAGVESY